MCSSSLSIILGGLDMSVTGFMAIVPHPRNYLKGNIFMKLKDWIWIHLPWLEVQSKYYGISTAASVWDRAIQGPPCKFSMNSAIKFISLPYQNFSIAPFVLVWLIIFEMIFCFEIKLHVTNLLWYLHKSWNGLAVLPCLGYLCNIW